MSAVHTAEISPSTIWRTPLPRNDEAVTRGLCRLMTLLSKRYVVSLCGLEHVAPERDPFVLVLNHSQRFEAVLLPSRLVFHRHGALIHFLADWQLLMVPFVALLYRRSRIIAVTRKNARPRWLNAFRPLFHHPRSPFERALARLEAGRSVGVFPEGTVNRDPHRLLRGSTSAARLALTAGVPVVAAGVRFPDHRGDTPIRDGARMTLDIGAPIAPPAVDQRPSRAQVRDFHSHIMRTLAQRCGKQWSADGPRRRIR